MFLPVRRARNGPGFLRCLRHVFLMALPELYLHRCFFVSVGGCAWDIRISCTVIKFNYNDSAEFCVE